jgi:hypothetical protein
MNCADDILDNIASRKTSGESFTLATVVRMVAATAAKAGAKAVIPPYVPDQGTMDIVVEPQKVLGAQSRACKTRRRGRARCEAESARRPRSRRRRPEEVKQFAAAMSLHGFRARIVRSFCRSAERFPPITQGQKVITEKS